MMGKINSTRSYSDVIRVLDKLEKRKDEECKQKLWNDLYKYDDILHYVIICHFYFISTIFLFFLISFDLIGNAFHRRRNCKSGYPQTQDD